MPKYTTEEQKTTNISTREPECIHCGNKNWDKNHMCPAKKQSVMIVENETSRERMHIRTSKKVVKVSLSENETGYLPK